MQVLTSTIVLFYELRCYLCAAKSVDIAILSTSMVLTKRTRVPAIGRKNSYLFQMPVVSSALILDRNPIVLILTVLRQTTFVKWGVTIRNVELAIHC